MLNIKNERQPSMSGNRIIGLDMHPDVFAAAALVGPNPLQVVREWVHDR